MRELLASKWMRNRVSFVASAVFGNKMVSKILAI
jgi:hypothetical protein